MGGKFILRVEDTDLERSTEDALKMQIEDLIWLGLKWDEGIDPVTLKDVGQYGPYRQSLRKQIYHEHAQKINQMMRTVNQRKNYDVITLGQANSMMLVNEQLNRGGFIGLLADRLFGSESATMVSFFNQTAAFPKGPFKLAAMLKRPVFMMLGLYRGGARYDIHFELLYDFSKVHRNRGAAFRWGLQRGCDARGSTIYDQPQPVAGRD